MNWEAIGAIGELVGSVAVVVTLGYLAVQVRYARGEVVRSVRQNRSDAVMRLEMAQNDGTDLIAIYAKADPLLGDNAFGAVVEVLTEQAGLTMEEAMAIIWDQLAWWQYRDQVVQNIEDLSAGERHQFDAGIVVSYGRSSTRSLWYRTVKSNLNPVTVRYVDDVLERMPAA